MWRVRIAAATVIAAAAGAGCTANGSSDGASDIINTWEPSTLDERRLPLGDDRIVADDPDRDEVLFCGQVDPAIGGAVAVGDWIDLEAGTWDRTAKIAVHGEVYWEEARYSEAVDGDVRRLVTDNLPVEDPTGTFPVAADDPARSIDPNPNTITPQDFVFDLPVEPAAADEPGCLPPGAVGVFRNGVVLFAPVDAQGKDAVAHEIQDECHGHPEVTGAYHYHSVARCLMDEATGPSTVVGFALDGYPIVVERDEGGRLPTNADLDECHGRTSPILLDGDVVTTYHYSATLEFPYVIGCFRGLPATAPDLSPPPPPAG